ncbi:MAG TPA: alkaline phosphatase family protein [Candidatus Tumulicola sp.]|jgi:phospholipase C
MNGRIATLSLAAFAFAIGLAGCSSHGGSAPGLPLSAGALDRRPATSTPVQHIVVMVQENRSFDDFFATYPGADGTTTGKTSKGKTIPLKKAHLAALDLNHMRADYLTDCDLQGSTCQMDGFDKAKINGIPAPPNYAYQYADPTEIKPYWTIASQYVLADHMFQTQGSGSFTAHQDLIAAGTKINNTQSIVDVPSNNVYWGCEAKSTTKTSLLTTKLKYLTWKGPFPCFTYPTGTLRDLLDAKGVTWRYYAPHHQGNNKTGAIWNAFDAIDAVRNGPEWQTNISMPETNVFNDIANGTLAQVSWVIPDQVDSDHPHLMNGQYHGPEWIASVVNAIGKSAYWKTTTIVIVWDDWGGLYDHVPPAFFDNLGGLGFRVPMLVVSPYVGTGVIDHNQYEFGSIVKYMEQTFSLGTLGLTDQRARSLAGMFHYSKPPRAFSAIPSKHDANWFLHQPPDDEPVDSE